MDKIINKNYIIIAVIFIILVLAWVGVLERHSGAEIDETIIQASIAFASARALNAIVSVVQSMEVSIVFVSVGLGEALDPINDMIEQYSSIMKYAIAALFIQKFLLIMTTNAIFNYLLTGVGFFVIGSAIYKKERFLYASIKVFLLMVFLRFAIAMMIILNGMANNIFIDQQIDDDIKNIQTATQNAQLIHSNSTIDDIGEDVRKRLEQQLQTLLTQQNEILARRGSIENRLADELNQLQISQDQLDSLVESLTLQQKLNFLNRSEEHRDLIAERDRNQEKVDVLKERINELNADQKVNQQQQLLIRNQLENKSDIAQTVTDITAGHSGSLNEKFNLKIGELTKQLSDTLHNMLSLIAAFLLKTMLFPLLFLYLLISAIRVLWRVDLIAINNQFMNKSGNNLSMGRTERATSIPTRKKITKRSTKSQVTPSAN